MMLVDAGDAASVINGADVNCDQVVLWQCQLITALEDLLRC